MAARRFSSLAVRAVLAFVVATAAAAVVLSMTLSSGPVPLHVRWKAGTTDAERTVREQRYHLTDGRVTEGTTRAYLLADTSTSNIRAMVQDPYVEDTADINRVRFRPRFSNDRQRRLIVFSVAAGVIAAVYVSLKALVNG